MKHILFSNTRDYMYTHYTGLIIKTSLNILTNEQKYLTYGRFAKFFKDKNQKYIHVNIKSKIYTCEYLSKNTKRLYCKYTYIQIKHFQSERHLYH